MAAVEELIRLRRFFVGHTTSERIEILNRLAAKDTDSNRWEKFIPHEMKEFDAFFDRFTPTELMQMAIISGQRIGNSGNGNLFGKYFIYDDVHHKITVLQNIDMIVKDVFDKELAVLGPEVVGRILAQFAAKRPYEASTYKMPLSDFMKVQKELSDISETNATVEINLVKMDNTGKQGSTLCEIFVDVPDKGRKLIFNS